jgi:NADH-ubiquinone oxidoreductase chain 6
MITTIILTILTFGILFSSIIAITSNNPIISIIFLITAFVNAAGYLILLGINFIGISYIVIYVGAIAVLFLFIILMINIRLTDILDTGYNFTKNLPVGLIIASLLLFIFFSSFATPLVLGLRKLIEGLLDFNLSSSLKTITGAITASPPKGGQFFLRILEGENFFISTLEGKLLEFTQIEVLGHYLYTYASIFLIILSLILLLAMLAIIIISKKNENENENENEKFI